MAFLNCHLVNHLIIYTIKKIEPIILSIKMIETLSIKLIDYFVKEKTLFKCRWHLMHL
jgi:hypothetical protein